MTATQCFKEGNPGEACGIDSDLKWLGPCIGGTECIDNLCTDVCKSEGKYGDGAICDDCIKPDPDCYLDTEEEGEGNGEGG